MAETKDEAKYVKPAQGTYRLTAQINQTDYTVQLSAVQPGSGASKCYMMAKRYDGRTGQGMYHVSQHAHGCECTCPDFVMRRQHLDPRGCKHILALAAFGMVVNEVPGP